MRSQVRTPFVAARAALHRLLLTCSAWSKRKPWRLRPAPSRRLELRESGSLLPVIAADGAVLGVVDAVEVERMIEQVPSGAITAGALAQRVAGLSAGDSLEEVGALGCSDREACRSSIRRAA